jgi:hypothetical protein
VARLEQQVVSLHAEIDQMAQAENLPVESIEKALAFLDIPPATPQRGAVRHRAFCDLEKLNRK